MATFRDAHNDFASGFTCSEDYSRVETGHLVDVLVRDDEPQRS